MELIKKDDYQILVINSKVHGRIEVLIDLNINNNILEIKWKVRKTKQEILYITNNYYVDGIWKERTLHRLITNANVMEYVDHINGNTLDNRRSNLRICTKAQNCKNRGLSKNKTSKVNFKGVTYYKSNKKYIARITNNENKIYLGSFNTAEEAAKAYNEAAIKYHGEFARLNVIR